MKKAKTIIPIIFIIIGLIIGAIPICGMLLNQTASSDVIKEYEETVDNMTDEEIKDKKDTAQLFNDTGSPAYYNALGINDVISYIEIPKINVYLPIYEGTDEATLESGIGHLEGTSLPVGGKGTHCVLTGHSGLTTKTMFSDLQELETGDKFYLHTLDEALCYEVFNIITILPNEAQEYLSVNTDDLVTLITCTPIGVNTHRLLVQGRRIYEN